MGVFDDMSSGRGVGVMGTLMAAVVLIGFIALYFLVFDDKMIGNGKRIDAVIRDQGTEIEHLKTVETQREKLLDDMAGRPAIAAEADQVLRQLRSDKGDLDARSILIPRIQAEIDKLDKQFLTYRNAYRDQVRAEGKGLTYPELRTLAGRTYKNVVVTSVDAVGMNIQHAEGTGRAEFENLPPEVREHFQYNPKEQLEARKAESDLMAEHGKAVDKTERSTREAGEAQKVEQAKQDQLELTNLQRAVTEINREISLTESSMQNARGTQGIFNPAPFQTKIKNLQAKRSAALARIEQLRSSLTH